MVQETKVKSGGVWRLITAPQVQSGGVWRAIQEIKVKSGGVWRRVFTTAGVNQPNIVVSQSASGQDVQSGVRFQGDGGSDEIDKDGITIPRVAGEWWSDEPEALIGDDYDVREASHVGGTGPWDFAAAAVGDWVNIGTGRNWWVQRTFGKGQEGPGTDNAKGNFEIRDSETQTIQATFTLDASATIT